MARKDFHILFVGIHTLLLCITRDYAYHSPLTSDAALEVKRRREPERAAACVKFFWTFFSLNRRIHNFGKMRSSLVQLA